MLILEENCILANNTLIGILLIKLATTAPPNPKEYAGVEPLKKLDNLRVIPSPFKANTITNIDNTNGINAYGARLIVFVRTVKLSFLINRYSEVVIIKLIANEKVIIHISKLI